MQSSFHFSQEVHNFVRDAWSELTDPERKTQSDKKTKSGFHAPKNKDACGFTPQEVGNKQTKKTCTFWTVCPYCYYMYEYESAYEECCLRCQNCRRAFQAVAISTGVSPPPSVVVEGKEYYCGFGFFPLGYVSGSGGGCFGVKKVEGGGVLDDVVEVSYGAEEEKGTNVTKAGNVFCGSSSGGGGDRDWEADGVMKGRAQVELKDAAKRVMRKVKTMAKCSKKITGRGVRIEQTRSMAALKVEGGDMVVDSQTRVGGSGDGAMAETDFEGEEDIF